MGEIADMMIDGTLDEQTGEYLDKGSGYPRTRVKGQYNTIPSKTRKKHWSDMTPSERKIASIRKEIAKAIEGGKPVDEARRDANRKYGKGWRERGLTNHANNQWSEEDLKEFQ